MFDLDGALYAKTAGQDVCLGMGRSVFGGQQLGVDEQIDHGVVAGHLSHLAAAQQVGARVADVGNVGGIVSDGGADRRRAHAH